MFELIFRSKLTSFIRTCRRWRSSSSPLWWEIFTGFSSSFLRLSACGGSSRSCALKNDLIHEFIRLLAKFHKTNPFPNRFLLFSQLLLFVGLFFSLFLLLRSLLFNFHDVVVVVSLLQRFQVLDFCDFRYVLQSWSSLTTLIMLWIDITKFYFNFLDPDWESALFGNFLVICFHRFNKKNTFHSGTMVEGCK